MPVEITNAILLDLQTSKKAIIIDSLHQKSVFQQEKYLENASI